MRKFLSVLLSVITVFSATACDKTPPKAFNPETDSPYKIEDVVKPNLMWDTAKVFTTVPEIKEEGLLDLGEGYENIKSFKFKSVPYTKKSATTENTWVFACMGTPDQKVFEKPELGYPAVVLVHGGAGHVFKDWIKYWNNKGYVAIAFDVFANQLDENGNKTPNPEGGPFENDGSNKDDPNDPTNSWVYHSVNNAMLCNNILRARADVSSSQIGIIGISWGGFITNIVSGVDKRFGAFVPIYGSGFVYEDSFWTNREGMEMLERQDWRDTFDPSSYLPYSTKPMFFVSGVDDFSSSVVLRMRAAKLPKGKVFYSQRYGLEHGNTWDETYEIYAFLEHVLFGKDTMSFIGDSKIENGRIYFSATNVKYDSVRLIYTTSDTSTDSHTWVFSQRLVTIRHGWCTAPENVTAYCFEFTHGKIDKNYRLSTPIYML